MSPTPTLAEVLEVTVADLITKSRAVTADGKITIAEIIEIGSSAVDGLVLAAQTVAGTTGEQKHAAVLEAVDHLYASVIAPLDIPRVPDFIERSIVDPALGSALHYVADGLIRSAVTRFKNLGIGGFTPSPAPAPAPAPQPIPAPAPAPNTGAAGP